MAGTADPGWAPAPARWRGDTDAVDVWLIDLARPGDGDLALLDEEERARAARFHQAIHRERFIAAHAALRRILAGYLGRDPAALRFGRGAAGKPGLVEGAGVQFNLSHSHERALVAVALDRAVGVDLELIRAGVDARGIAARFFTIDEARHLEDLPEPARDAAFYALWTCKEACLKARGDGLQLALDRVAVPLAGGLPAMAMVAPPGGAPCEPWGLAAVPALPGYAAAVAAAGDAWRTRCWRWR